jgi:signal transduction histidine kinase/DNA-binding NarL/FixJ family response regulator
MSSPITVSELEDGLNGLDCDPKGAQSAEENKMHWLTLGFLETETETNYMKDLWRRESWRFAVTNVMVMCLTFVLAVYPYFKNDTVRMAPIFLTGFYAALAVIVVFVLWASTFRNCKHWTQSFFSRVKIFVQVVTLIGAAFFPTLTVYNSFLFNESSMELFQFKMLRVGLVPYETVLYVLFSPLVLSYMNIRFKHHFIVCATCGAQLMFLTAHLAANPEPIIHIDHSSRPLVLVFIFPWLFMMISAWVHERNDRLSYVLRKQQEKARLQELQVAHLESKSAAEEALLSFLCHEIRNPYNGLLGYAELTHATTSSLIECASEYAGECGGTTSIEPVPELLKGLRKIQGWCSPVLKSSQHMLDLLDNVLDLSKLENNKLVLHANAVNLYEICQEVKMLLAPTMNSGVKLVVEAEPGRWMVGDRLRWRQLLVNLLSNAFKTTDKGTVRVQVIVRSRSTAPGSSGPPQDELSVAISDTGSGISPSAARSLFKKFESNAFAHNGSGVGLVRSQHITILMGGSEISVESPYLQAHGWGEGDSSSKEASGACKEASSACKEASDALCKGTRLFFTVPFVGCEAPAVAKTQQSVTIEDSHTKSSCFPTVLRFLLVEDDAMNQLIMKAKLQDLRFGLDGEKSQDADSARPCEVECIGVDTAEKAIELVTGRKARFDIILMDQHLEDAGGVLTGLQAVTQLRAQGHTLPMIMCTGNCAARDKEEYLLAGATHVWAKPYPAMEQMAADLQDVFSASSSYCLGVLPCSGVLPASSKPRASASCGVRVEVRVEGGGEAR